MTRSKTLAAAAAILSIILVAAGATFRDAHHDAPQSSDFDQRFTSINQRFTSIKKGDRLPLPAPTSLAETNAQSEVAAPVTAPPEPAQLPLATEDDIRQAEAEHRRHRNICPRGRTYFTVDHHQYWRCKL